MLWRSCCDAMADAALAASVAAPTDAASTAVVAKKDPPVTHNDRHAGGGGGGTSDSHSHDHDRGTRRPDPAGRAFIALLSCAVDGLSAKRFDEYLSLGQVPRVADGSKAPAVVVPLDEVFAAADLTGEGDPSADETGERDLFGPANEPIVSDDDAVVAGTLRSPWKWEELIVESAVVGGRTREEGKARWRRRLDGLAADFTYRIEELKKDEPESARIARFERDRRNLAHLRQFALPIVDALAEWPEQATWGAAEYRWQFVLAPAWRLRRLTPDGLEPEGEVRLGFAPEPAREPVAVPVARA